jgi:hypothetical protein
MESILTRRSTLRSFQEISDYQKGRMELILCKAQKCALSKIEKTTIKSLNKVNENISNMLLSIRKHTELITRVRSEINDLNKRENAVFKNKRIRYV